MPIHKTSTLKLSQHSLDVFPHTDTEVHFQSVCEVTGATEPLRLEETSQIPNPTHPPYPLSLSATSTALGHPQGWRPPPPSPCLLCGEGMVPQIYSEPPSAQPEAVTANPQV